MDAHAATMTAEAEQQQQIKEATSLDAEGTYEVIRIEGLRELERTTGALFWSGLAAGLSMGFSFLAEGLLRTHLPEADWRPLVAKLGYSVGFLIVILGNQQLFTENTLMPVVPLLHRWSTRMLRNTLRLWCAVFVANMLGALVFAAALGRLEVVDTNVQSTLSMLAQEAMKSGTPLIALRAVYAGWLVALMVWMLPGAESSKPLVIIVMTYMIGVGGFAHVVAGSVEVLYAAVRGELPVSEAVLGYILPTLIGNVVGGVLLVAGLNHAQATSGS